MLLSILIEHREEIVARARARAAGRRAPRARNAQLIHGIPIFLDQLTRVMRGQVGELDAMSRSAVMHGDELLRTGFTVAQVVHGYGDVCQVVADLAHSLAVKISATELKVFNACLDEAIAHAVTEYGRLRELTASEKGTQQIGVFAHELRNLLGSAALAFGSIRDGHVSATGKTGAILGRSLESMRELVNRTLTEVRLEAHVHHARPVFIGDLLEEIEAVATLEAHARELHLVMHEVARDVRVLADRSLLASALGNLVQNALKFTHASSTVTVRVRTTPERALIDVADECGGLGPGKSSALFRPFSQHGADTSGVGLGLTISRRAIEANGGTLKVRDLPGVGCVFTADLPRLPMLELSDADRLVEAPGFAHEQNLESASPVEQRV